MHVSPHGMVYRTHTGVSYRCLTCSFIPIKTMFLWAVVWSTSSSGICVVIRWPQRRGFSERYTYFFCIRHLRYISKLLCLYAEALRVLWNFSYMYKHAMQQLFMHGLHLWPLNFLFQAGEIQTILCLGFGQSDVTYSGTLSGDIYVWTANKLTKVIPQVHKVCIFVVALCFVNGFMIWWYHISRL